MRRLAIVMVALVAASCGGSPAPSESQRPVHFSGLSGVVYGSGEGGVVLANQSDRDREAWAPFARYLAENGLRVLAFDYGGRFPEDEVAAAAQELRRNGARHVVLIGASEGAKAAVMAGARAPAGVVGVVSLSPERYAQGRDVLPSARRLGVPALFVTARTDPFSAADTPRLERAAVSAAKRLVVLPGAAHGVDLTASKRVRSAVLTFVRARVRDPAPPEELAARCGSDVADPSRTFWFRARDGVRLDGAEIGSGSTVVVLAHQDPSDLCPWVGYASMLAHSGLGAFLFDFRGYGHSEDAESAVAAWRLQDDVAGAVAEARRQGAQRVFLVGGSLGGAAVVAAAPGIRPPVDGVVSLSGEIDIDALVGSHGLNPLPIANRIRVPLLLVASEQDPLASAAQMRLLAGRVSGPVRVVARPGGQHGLNLLDPTVVRTLAAFYRQP